MSPGFPDMKNTVVEASAGGAVYVQNVFDVICASIIVKLRRKVRADVGVLVHGLLQPMIPRMWIRTIEQPFWITLVCI